MKEIQAKDLLKNGQLDVRLLQQLNIKILDAAKLGVLNGNKKEKSLIKDLFSRGFKFKYRYLKEYFGY